MIPLPLLDGDTLLIDSSSTGDVMSCKRLAEYSFCRRLKSVDEKAALQAGKILHQVLEARYRAATSMHAQSPDVEAVMRAVAREEYSRWQPPEDDFRTFDTMSRCITEYGLAYPFESFEVVRLHDGRPFIEQPFMMPLATLEVDNDFWVQEMKLTEHGLVKNGPPVLRHLTSIKVVWIGRIDLVYETNGRIYVMDHKTSTMATNTNEFTLSHQLYGYAAAVEFILGVQVAGIVVNRIVWRKPTKTGVPFTFERPLISVSRDLLTEWRTDVTHIIASLVQSIADGYLPKETSHCYGKFGQCPFFKVCSLETNDQREIMLNSGEYMTNEWSPLTQ
jgi:hypothetical protein